MSQHQYRGIGLSTFHSGQQLTPLSNLPIHPYQQHSPAPSQTLPPLHTQQSNSYQSTLYRNGGSAPETPLTPRTPGTPMSIGTSSFLPQIAPQLPANAHHINYPYPPIVSAISSPPSIQHGNSASFDAATSTGNSPYTQMSLPHLAPAFFGLLSPSHTMPTFGVQSQVLPQTQDNRRTEPRLIPVVGSQGRRGILPSATGRPSAIGAGVGGPARLSGAMPAKDVDGKFPCVFCNKTYLHLKHLKRHHLRHTGERPYQCCLCQETFCRSDILKRHFNKCSLRRGNPTGATHLTHAQAHLRPTQSAPSSASVQQPPASLLSSSDSSSSFRGPWPTDSATFPSIHQKISHVPHGLPYDSNRSSRSSSILRPDSSSDEDQKQYSSTSSIVRSTPSLEIESTNGLAGNGTRKGDWNSNGNSSFHYSQDRLPNQGHQDTQGSSYFTTSSVPPPPAMNTQAEPVQPFYYSRGSFQQYPGNHIGQTQPGDWSSYFQPGAHGNVMFSSPPS